jgi:group II intron reverse transcriptase/maturase
VTTEVVKADSAGFLAGLQAELKNRSYRPSLVLRVWIPKVDGKQRALGIPTVKDRVVQTALVILLGPIFEADFNEYSFGYRPGRSAHQALDAIKGAILAGKTEVVDADLSGYFDTIPHAELLRLVARRVSDGSILKLVKLSLKAPIVEEQEGKRTIRPNASGTPQGCVISPLLANLYLNGLDHQVNDQPHLDARMVRYADDLVLLCRSGNGLEYYQRLKVYLEHRGLALNEAKSRLVDVRQACVRFLGFDVRWRFSRFSGWGYVHLEPSRKAQQRLRDAVRQELNHWTRRRSCSESVRRVNRIVQGWSNYYHYGNCAKVFRRHQHWLQNRFRTWLWWKYDRTLGRYGFFTNDRLHGQYHLWTLPRTAQWLR